jgi:tryptophanase
MSAIVIEFPSARESGSRSAHNANSGDACAEAIELLTDSEIAAIKSLSMIFQMRGSEAFDIAAKRQFFIISSLVRQVLGEARLHEILTAAKYI